MNFEYSYNIFGIHLNSTGKGIGVIFEISELSVQKINTKLHKNDCLVIFRLDKVLK